MSGVEVPRGATRLLTRVLVVPLVILLVAGAFVVTARALAVRETAVSVSQSPRPVVEQPWKDSYSRRFPGCVPAVLWPGRETPVAVVVQWNERKVQRVERGTPLRRALVAHGADAGRIIGACYR